MKDYLVYVDPRQFTADNSPTAVDLVDAQFLDTITFSSRRSEPVLVTITPDTLFGGLSSFTLSPRSLVTLKITDAPRDDDSFLIEALREGTEHVPMTGTIKVGGIHEDHPLPHPRPHHN